MRSSVRFTLISRLDAVKKACSCRGRGREAAVKVEEEMVEVVRAWVRACGCGVMDASEKRRLLAWVECGLRPWLRCYIYIYIIIIIGCAVALRLGVPGLMR